jgi:hypothetical protein
MIAYVDAAGTHRAARAFSLAVYVASERAWESFESEWSALLEREGLGWIHMTDLEAGRSLWKDKLTWTRARKDSILRELAPIINRHVAMGFVEAVDVRSHRRILGPCFDTSIIRRQRDFKNPHVYALWQIVGLVYAIVKDALPHGERVAFICDRENRGLRGLLLRHYEEMIDNNPHLERWISPDLHFGSSKRLPPLQAADCLAWESAHEMRQSLRLFGRDPQREFLKTLHVLPKVQIHYQTESKLTRLRRRAVREGILL